MNIQFAVKDGEIYVLEVNPRASRTVAVRLQGDRAGRWRKVAARVMVGKTLAELGITAEIEPGARRRSRSRSSRSPSSPASTSCSGPEMQSTGEVMGIDIDFAGAFAKTQLGAGVKLPMSGTVFISVRDADKKHVVTTAQKLYDTGFQLVATRGTATFLQEKGIPVRVVNKVLEGRPHIVDAIKNNEICMVINTTHGAQAVADSFSIRRNTLVSNIAYYTTTSGARAAVDGIVAMRDKALDVKPIQEYLG